MVFPSNVQMSRRLAIGTLAATAAVTLAPAHTRASPPSQTKSVPFCALSKGIERAELEQLLANMRKARGCLMTRAQTTTDGKVTVWQEWKSRTAHSNFWRAYDGNVMPSGYQRLSL